MVRAWLTPDRKKTKKKQHIFKIETCKLLLKNHSEKVGLGGHHLCFVFLMLLLFVHFFVCFLSQFFYLFLLFLNIHEDIL